MQKNNIVCVVKVGADQGGLNLRFSHLTGIINLSDVLRSSGNY